MKRFALVLFVCIVGALALQASTVPAATISGGGNIDGLPVTPLEMGFRFTPTVNLSVTALGLWDTTAGAIPSGAEVGLFGAGPLLASVAFPGTSSYDNGFRYIDLTTPITLTAGKQYTILSYYPGSSNAPLALLDGVTFNSDLSSVHFTNSYLNPGDGLTFLGTVPGSLSDYSQFGANFLFQAAPATPEPGTFGLLIAGLGSLAAAGFTRKPARQ